MTDQNPYVAPGASLSVEQDLYQPSIFSFQGRLGRLRYLAYGIGTSMVLMVLVGVFMAITGATAAMTGGAGSSPLLFAVMAVFYVATLVLSIMFGKRRLNDLNRSGWWFLLFIVPVVNLLLTIYLVFFPGSAQENKFGAPAVANSIGVKILGWILPFVFLVGILAAIAIPAYVDYTARAAQSQAQ